MDQHWLETMHAQHALVGLSDRRERFGQDPMMALLNQCHRARSGQDDGILYFSIPF